MDLVRETPDFLYVLRGADGRQARVNDETVHASFLVSPEAWVRDWPVRSLAELEVAHLEAVFALQPEVVILGCGDTQAFPHARILAACLQRGIGLESMVNAAAARTFNVLAGEGRKVVAAFILAG